MSIYKFTDSSDNNKTYNYKILVYPNITFQKDLEKDSYVIVLGNIIRELNKIRDDIHWTIFSPGGNIQSLSFENTLQLPIKFPPYPNAMRLHFNQIDIIKQIDFRKNDYDIVFASSSRLMTAFLGSVISRIKNVSLYLDIRDLFSDTLKDLLSPKINFFLMPIIKLIEYFSFIRATKINIVSKGFKTHVESILNNNNISFYTNGIDEIFLQNNN